MYVYYICVIGAVKIVLQKDDTNSLYVCILYMCYWCCCKYVDILYLRMEKSNLIYDYLREEKVYKIVLKQLYEDKTPP